MANSADPLSLTEQAGLPSLKKLGSPVPTKRLIAPFCQSINCVLLQLLANISQNRDKPRKPLSEKDMRLLSVIMLSRFHRILYKGRVQRGQGVSPNNEVMALMRCFIEKSLSIFPAFLLQIVDDFGEIRRENFQQRSPERRSRF